MELPVSAQALLFGQAVLLALGLGIFYDILRAARRLAPGCTLLADVLFGLTLGAGFLLFALTAGKGLFRLYIFAAVFLTEILYFCALSPLILPAVQAVFSLLGRLVQILCAPARFFLKFLKKISKTLFARCRKWFTITCKQFFDWKHAQLERSRRRNEIRQVVSDRQAGDSDPRCICHRYPGAPARTDPRQGRRGAGADKLHRKHTAGK